MWTCILQYLRYFVFVNVCLVELRLGCRNFIFEEWGAFRSIGCGTAALRLNTTMMVAIDVIMSERACCGPNTSL